MLTVDLTPLKPGQHHLTVELAATDLELDPAAFDQVVADLRLDHQPDRLVVHLVISAVATLECDRTLALFDKQLEGEHTVIFLPAPEAPAPGAAAADDGVRPLPDPGEPVDLTEVARDTLLLAVPARCIAPGAEERDIQLVYGQGEEHIDHRWEALRRLRERS